MVDAAAILNTAVIQTGVPLPLGTYERCDGVNFAVFSRHATQVSLLLFDTPSSEVFRFVREMIALRKRHEVLRRDTFYTAQDIRWFNPSGDTPRWDGPDHTLGCVIAPHDGGGRKLCLLFNAGLDEVNFTFPATSDEHPRRVMVDTAQPAPRDISGAGAEPLLQEQERYRMQNRSLVILMGR